MRAKALLLTAILSAGFLAGCVAGTKDPTPPTSTSPTTPTGKVGVDALKVLAPLNTKLAGTTATGALWIAPGTTVDLKATPPTNAGGAVAYVWAVGATPTTAIGETKFTPDTGSKGPDYLKAGQSRGIKFNTPGMWEMHCHPHAYMRSNVTVVEGYQSPATVDVYIIEPTNNAKDYRYYPENIVVGPGTTVMYHNKGEQPHTATSLRQDAPVKKIPITGATGTWTAAGTGWQTIRLFTTDTAGAIGVATYDVYVASLPEKKVEKIVVDQNAGGAPGEVTAPQTKSFVLDYNGTAYLNFSVTDAVASQDPGGLPAPVPNNAQVTIHLKQQGETQDTMTSTAKSAGNLTARVAPVTYTLSVLATQGAKVTGTVTLEVVYDAIPPAPTAYVDPESKPHQH